MCQCKLWSFSVFLILRVYSVTCYNVDSSNYAIYTGPQASMFGFSVAIHKETNNGWLIVGAPEAQSTYQSSVHRGGVVYKCPTDRDESCQEVPFDTTGDHYSPDGIQMDNKTEQWFGATVSASGSDGGPVVACAPRYTWFPKKARRDPVGTCYVSNGQFNQFNEYSPCRTYHWGYNRQGSCQAGFSAAINSIGDRLFIGSPGSWYWQGQMYSIDAHAEFEYKPLNFADSYGAEGQVHQQSLETRPAVFSTKEGTEKDDDSYMGYSTIVGDFSANGEQGLAVGMPRGNNLRGRVLLFTWNLTNFLPHFQSDQIGSYYGYALAASDVDGDGKIDLIIGAPMYTIQNNEGKYDVGRVYVVYHESDRGKFVATYEIDGFKSKSRFGQALASLGDINQDGYGDFAVGAPYDGEHERGAVYIYHGSKKGVREKYSQVIYAETIALGLKTFGFSLTGGLDLDGNGYPDMAAGAYLSNNVYFFRSRPVVVVEASVKYLTQNKEVDIKQSDYTLRSGGRAVRTQIDFCIRYYGKGIPPYIDLQLQYVLDAKKVSDPRMGFVGNENLNRLNDSIRLYKDQAETCKTKDVFVKSEIRDKLTSLVAEVKYWMQDDQGVAYEHKRDPRSVLKPVLDLNSPPSRKDSIHIHKECGSDNICIPDLSIAVTPSVDKYLLGSKELLFFDVIVSNTGEDAYESTLEVRYPENVFYSQAKDEKVETHVLCNTNPQTPGLLKCEIGNPIPKDKIVRFKIFWQPVYKVGMAPTYDFVLKVNSTNQEEKYTRGNNERKISVGIWSNSKLEVKGRSFPGELFFNSSLYTADISQQSASTPIADRLSEKVLGPQVVHVYYLKNEGPATIEETEVFFAWPAYTLDNQDFLYLLEPPQFSSDNNVQCGPIPANYRGFDLDVSQKSIWERLNLHVSEEGGGRIVEATAGGGSPIGQHPVEGIGGGESSATYERRKQTGQNIFQNQSSGGNFNNFQSQTGQSSGGNFNNFQTQTGQSGNFNNFQAEKVGNKQFYYRCLKRVNGREEEVDCGSDFLKTVNNSWSLDQVGIRGKANYLCYEDINGRWNPVPCNLQIDGNQQVGVGGGGGKHVRVNIVHKCREELNGVWHDVACGPGGTFPSLNSSRYQPSFGGKIQQVGNTEVKFVHECYRTVNGVEQKVECGADFPFINQGGQTGSFHQQGSSQYYGGSGSQQAGGQYSQQGSGTRQQTGGSRYGPSGSQFSHQAASESQQGSGSQYSHQASHGSQYSQQRPHQESQQQGSYGSQYSQQGASASQQGSQYSQQRESGSHLTPQQRPNESRGSQYSQQGGSSTSQQGSYGSEYSASRQGSQYSQQGGSGSNQSSQQRPQESQHESRGSQHSQQGASSTSQQGSYGSQYSQQGASASQQGSQYSQQRESGSHLSSQQRPQESRGSQYSQQGASSASQQGSYGSQYSQQGASASRQGSQYSQQGASRSNQSSQQRPQESQQGSQYSQQGSHGSQSQQSGYYGSQNSQQGSQYSQRGQQNSQQAGNSGSQHSQQGSQQHGGSYFPPGAHGSSSQGSKQAEGEEQYEDEDEYEDYEEEQDNGKAITSYINPGSNEVVSENNGKRRDPKTYGNYNGADTSGLTPIEAAAIGRVGVTTLDLGDLEAGSSNRGGSNSNSGGGHLEAGSSNRGSSGGGQSSWRQESHWSETRQLPPTPTNDLERDNVPTDRPTTRNRFYGRKKRQVLDYHPSIGEISERIKCNSVNCIYMRCTLQNLERDKEVAIALRARVNGRVLRNVTSTEPLSFSTVMVTRINKLPYIGTPVEQNIDDYEVTSTVSKSEVEIKPDIIPLWVVVLSAVAGTIILLLLVFLLYKLGFFKRNRPSSRAPERQPLNRNGYHHGDEAL